MRPVDLSDDGDLFDRDFVVGGRRDIVVLATPASHRKQLLEEARGERRKQQGR